MIYRCLAEDRLIEVCSHKAGIGEVRLGEISSRKDELSLKRINITPPDYR
jgi:hypothetical protein